MYELKKTGKVFTSKFVGTGLSSYEKRIYRAAGSQGLRNTGIENLGSWLSVSKFWHFPLRTAFYRQLFPSPFKNKVPNKDRDRCNMSVARIGRYCCSSLAPQTVTFIFITLPLNPKFCFAASSAHYTSQVCKFTDKLWIPHRLVSLDGYDQHGT